MQDFTSISDKNSSEPTSWNQWDIQPPESDEEVSESSDDKSESLNDLSVEESEEQGLPPEEIDPATLPSQTTYHCATHPNKNAHCICVKCGKLLCNDCGWLIRGRRYCQTCTLADDDLIAAYQRDLIRPKLIQAAIEMNAYLPPKRFADIPRALGNMVRNSPVFFIAAKDSAYHLTYYLAAIALIPNALVSWFANRDNALAATPPSLKEGMAWMLSQPDSTQILVTILATLCQLLLLDLIFWACTRAFTQAKLSFIQAGNTLNFCLIPLILTALGTYYGWNWLSFIALALMIIEATVATRSSTQCTVFQGMGVMLSFIFISTLGGFF